MSERSEGGSLNDSQPSAVSSSNAPVSVLVTGGTGLVGSHLIKQLHKDGQKVRAIYRNEIPAFVKSVDVEWLKGDILDVNSLADAMQDVSQVYHCAAIVSFSKEQRREMFASNVEGTSNVVNTCINIGVKKLCYVSTVAVLGKSVEGLSIDENVSVFPQTLESAYAKSKYLAELEVWRGIGEGLNAVVVNPSIILGYGNWNAGSTKLFKSSYEEFPYYTEGVTGFVDVVDVVKAMIALMESNITGERFIVSSENMSFKKVFTLISQGFNKKIPSKNVSPVLGKFVVLAEAIKSFITGNAPLVTKETAQAGQLKVYFKNDKLNKLVPSFTYTRVTDSILRICKEFQGTSL